MSQHEKQRQLSHQRKLLDKNNSDIEKCKQEVTDWSKIDPDHMMDNWRKEITLQLALNAFSKPQLVGYTTSKRPFSAVKDCNIIPNNCTSEYKGKKPQWGSVLASFNKKP